MGPHKPPKLGEKTLFGAAAEHVILLRLQSSYTEEAKEFLLDLN